uniref:Uncharacterized protein n=1 Tax=Ciona intestinalis TaxID=7719 RepID=H2XYE9_CIOIN
MIVLPKRVAIHLVTTNLHGNTIKSFYDATKKILQKSVHYGLFNNSKPYTID